MNMPSAATTSENQTINGFSTSDLAGSAVLVTLGFELSRIEWSDPQRVRFVFRPESAAKKTMEDFWADRLQVNPRKYWDNVKMLKARLHASQP